MTRENAPQMGHAVNVTSGNDISTYSFGFSYTSQEPVIGLENPEVKSLYERYTLRLILNITSSKRAISTSSPSERP